MRWSIGLVVVSVALAALVGSWGSARAQSSPVSELWRQWAVLEQQWKAERAEVARDRARLEARRKARSGEKGEGGEAAKGSPKRGG